MALMQRAAVGVQTPAEAASSRPSFSRTGGVVVAAGGTGGHFFPAEALAAELIARGHAVTLMTDARSGGERSPVFAGSATHVLQGAGIVGRGPVRAARAGMALLAGTMQARRVLARLQPSVVVGFGGYPSVPPVLAARMVARRPRILLHEGNAVLGGANRVLAKLADQVALSFPTGGAGVITGLPIRPGFAPRAYHPPEPGAPIRLLVIGGSLGARVLSQVVPAAIGLLPAGLRARLRVTQQCRQEDLAAVRETYAVAGIAAELDTFLGDMPARLAATHFVIGRAGASTCAELATVGRPALLVPLPSPDNHQRANAAAIDAAVIEQPELTPERLADLLSHRLDCPDMLDVAAHAIAAHGMPHAASRLADLVEQVSAGRISGEEV